MIYTEINITGLEEIKARVRELADLTERMHVALGRSWHRWFITDGK